ncbi:MAG: Hsp20/alpha crystallin family protein [Bacillota bacterium]|nr:Hsp20/alpha crystallin family protein [Bacillota bacterium]
MGELAKGPQNPDPLDLGFTRLWQELDRLFSQTMAAVVRAAESAGAPLKLNEFFPRIEAERRGQEVVATVEIPGARPDSLEVSVSADYLTVRGEAETRQDHTQCYRTFYRTVPLPARVRPEAARTEQQGPARLVVRVPVA